MQTIDRRTFVLGSASVWALAGCGGGDSSPDGMPPMTAGVGPAATSATGVKFEARPLAHKLLVTDSRGAQRTVGGVGRALGRLNYPSDVAVFQDRGYVVDTGNHRVQVFDAAGTALFTMGEGVLFYPGGIDVRPVGEVLVSDSRNGRIVGFLVSGSLVRKFGQGLLSAPKGLAVLADSGLLVADPGLRKVLKLSAAGTLMGEFGTGWVLPWDVATDGKNVFVADAAVNAIAVLSMSGQRIGSMPLDKAPTYISYRNGALQVG